MLKERREVDENLLVGKRPGKDREEWTILGKKTQKRVAGEHWIPKFEGRAPALAWGRVTGSIRLRLL